MHASSYVFDGKAPEMKAGELAKRKEKKEEAEKALTEAQEAGTAADVEKFGKRTLKVTREHNEECKKLLRLMGVPVVEAPCEAEASCAELCKKGLVYASATEDMDTLTFGTPLLARNLMKPASADVPILQFDYAKACEELHLTREQFVDLCILCGCDYTDSVKGCGPVSALKLIQEYGSIDEAMKELRANKKYVIPEPFPFTEARRLFLQPEVVDCDTLPELKWTPPDEEGLVQVRSQHRSARRGADARVAQFLVHEKTFEEGRVRKAIEKIKAAKSKSSQNRLESFFGCAAAACTACALADASNTACPP